MTSLYQQASSEQSQKILDKRHDSIAMRVAPDWYMIQEVQRVWFKRLDSSWMRGIAKLLSTLLSHPQTHTEVLEGFDM